MGFFDRLKKGLAKTRETFTNKIEKLIIGYADIDDDLLDELEETLIMSDVGVKTTERLMADVRKGIKKKDINTPEDLKPFLAEKISEILSTGSDETRIASAGPTVLLVIGVNGVGKTTTLAKIAAQCVLEKGISTAFITADTYRISAVEQLKTYADILGLPIAIVYTPDELKEAIQKFRQKQLILIDTAGRSQHNRRQMAELKEFLAVNQNIEKYLVLSATTKNEDAKDIIDKFSVCKPDKVIFTKTDETKSLGIILNILRRKEMRLSYLTNGQSVPDDIVPAEAGKLAELFLR